jgi:hypothetical protein
VKSLAGHTVVDAVAAEKLEDYVRHVQWDLQELAKRMRIITGDADLSVVDQPVYFMSWAPLRGGKK